MLVSAAFIPAAGQQREFAGTWQAKFKGDAFMTLRLEIGQSISGTLSGGSIRVNEDGDLVEASGGGKELPISNVRLDGDKLSFDWKVDDETLKFEMKLTGEREAQLQFMDLPEGQKIKAFPIAKK